MDGQDKQDNMSNILIMGGTRFLGAHVAMAAAAQGHRVTLFTRGQTEPPISLNAERLRGDRRTGDFAALRGRRWDAVIDTSGYIPREVRGVADALREATDHYTFVSSISAYANAKQGHAEDGPLGTLADPSTEEITGETYGPLKAACEREALAGFGQRALIIRPGLIVGRFDPTDRFTYWPWRMAQGGDVAAPGRAGRVVQFIDAQDLAEWMLRLVAGRITGVFNATGPATPLPMGDLLAACQRVAQVPAKVCWLREEFLLTQGVLPWSEMPLWIPESDPDTAGFMDIKIARALAHGLTFRPVEDTVRDALAWARSRGAARAWKAGLTREREVELLRVQPGD
jgi:2'-hydroxyisoflavone reductase